MQCFEATQYFVLHEIILSVNYYVIRRTFPYHRMAYRVSLPGVREPRAGRPRKYEDGYCKAAKVLRILEENFIEWRQVKHEEGLTDDNAVARYLLDCRKQLVTMQESSPQHTHNSVSLKLVC